MFYLLEEINRIVDSEEDKVEIIEEGGVKFLRNQYGYKLGEITKQSENVFDLVEVGIDLIKHKRNINHLYVELVIGGFDNFFKTIETTAYYVHLHDVLAIYKPNANGDYIKVWEKEE